MRTIWGLTHRATCAGRAASPSPCRDLSDSSSFPLCHGSTSRSWDPFGNMLPCTLQEHVMGY